MHGRNKRKVNNCVVEFFNRFQDLAQLAVNSMESKSDVPIKLTDESSSNSSIKLSFHTSENQYNYFMQIVPIP